MKPPKNVELKNPKDYKILRKPLPRQDTPLKTNGTAIFGIDKKLPGMMYAVVERNPRFAGKVKSFDDTETKKIPGVKFVFKTNRLVFEHLYEGVAVVADSIWAAMQGRKVLKVEWDDSGFDHHSTEQLYEKMKDQLQKGNLISYKTQGNFQDAFQKAEKKLEALYETPYESHSCMEPLNCIADVKEDSCGNLGTDSRT
ncbi:MAG: xanthine dehydrogenase family protein [Cyclobacteriaceae bacterium]